MNSSLPEDPALLKTGKAAKQLGISVPTLKKMIKSGRIFSQVTEGGHYLIPVTEIERLKIVHQPTDEHPLLIDPEDKISVLLLEDIQDYQDVLKLTLENKGFQVNAVGDIDKALLSLTRKTPDIIVTDLYSKEKNALIGIELMQLVRGKPSWADIPIIVLSGLTASKESYRIEAIEAGASLILDKPEGFFQLADKIIQVLSSD